MVKNVVRGVLGGREAAVFCFDEAVISYVTGENALPVHEAMILCTQDLMPRRGGKAPPFPPQAAFCVLKIFRYSR